MNLKKIRKLSKSHVLNKDKLLQYGSSNYSSDLNNKNSKFNLFVLTKKYENKFNFDVFDCVLSMNSVFVKYYLILRRVNKDGTLTW